MSIFSNDPIEQFKAAMRERGLIPPSQLICDGEIHRCDVEGKGGRGDGAYLLHLDGIPAGGFQNHRDGRGWENWRPDIGRQLTPAEEAAHRERIKADRVKREAKEAQQKAEARAASASIWEHARPCNEHGYLTHKGVSAHGARVIACDLARQIAPGHVPAGLSGDLFTIPASDIDGVLQSVQFVMAGGEKRFMKDGRKQGCFFPFGELSPDGVLLVCEGFATAASIHQATGLPVVVAFDSGNLPPVAKALRGKYPNVKLFLCADDDIHRPDNPGMTAANEAAQAVGGRVIAPHFGENRPDSQSDFNDLHKLAGLEAVRQQIMAGMAAAQSQGKAVQPENTAPASKPLPLGFMLKTTGNAPGLYWKEPDSDDLHRLCPPLHVEARTRDGNGKNWGRLLSWEDAEGRTHRWAMPASMTCGESAELAKVLVDGGLDVKPSRKARDKLAAFIMESSGAGFVRCTSRTGWHGDAFVLPNEVIAPPNAERVFLQTDRDETLGMTQSGTLESWRDNVAVLASGNSRPLFAISLGFAAPLAALADESGGFHFVGPSSIGKTTIQLAAGSVWGHPQFYKIMWRATANGLEGVCAARNDLLLIIDDLGECDGREAGAAAYMIANGQGKARSARDGSERDRKSWRLLFLSSGEIPLSQHMAEAGKQIKAGQEVRMVDLPASAGGSLGVFDVLTGGETTGSGLSERVRTNTMQHYGTAGRAFLRLVSEQREEIAQTIKAAKADFVQKYAPSTTDGQVMRTVGRFALVAIAGEMATDWGLTGWRQGEAWEAAARLFGEWLALRGGNGNTESARGIAAVRAFLEAHGESRFTPWDADEEARQRTINRAGFRRHENGGQWFYVLPESYRRELCKGFDHQMISEALRANGMLDVQSCDVGQNGSPKRYQKQARLPGIGRTWCYLITPVIWHGGEGEREGL